MISLGLGCLWLITANVLALLPSRDNHWARAYGLIVIGVPLVGYIIYENGLFWGGVFVIAAASILRWPVIYLVRWARDVIRGGKG